MTPFATLWAGDLLDQVGFGPGDRVLDLAAVGGRGGSTLPFGDASFDVVVCHHGLQLLPDWGRALASVVPSTPSAPSTPSGSGRHRPSNSMSYAEDSDPADASPSPPNPAAQGATASTSRTAARELEALLQDAGYTQIRTRPSIWTLPWSASSPSTPTPLATAAGQRQTPQPEAS